MDNESFTIRSVELRDLKDVLSVLHQLSPLSDGEVEGEITELQPVLEKIVKNKDYSMLVCEDHGKVIGTATLLLQQNLSHKGRSYGHIENVVVDSSYRGKGIGLMLVKALVEKGKEAGCYKIILSCASAQIPFYQKIGFKVHETEMRLNLG